MDDAPKSARVTFEDGVLTLTGWPAVVVWLIVGALVLFALLAVAASAYRLSQPAAPDSIMNTIRRNEA